MISVYEALLRIESRQFLREMNATLDYSYLDTPRSGASIRWLACNTLLLYCVCCYKPISPCQKCLT